MKKFMNVKTILMLFGLIILQSTGCDRKDNAVSESPGGKDDNQKPQLITIERSNKTTVPNFDDWDLYRKTGGVKIYYHEIPGQEQFNKASVSYYHPTINSLDALSDYGNIVIADYQLNKIVDPTFSGGFDYGFIASGDTVQNVITKLRAPYLNFSISGSSVVQNYSRVINPRGMNRIINISLGQKISASQDLQINFDKAITKCEIYFVPGGSVDQPPLADTIPSGNISFSVTQLKPSSSIIIPKEELQNIRSKWSADALYTIAFSGFDVVDTLHLVNKNVDTIAYHFPVYVTGRHEMNVILEE